MNYYNDMEGAKTALLKAIELNTEHLYAHYALAILLKNKLNDRKNGDIHFEISCKVNPTDKEKFLKQYLS